MKGSSPNSIGPEILVRSAFISHVAYGDVGPLHRVGLSYKTVFKITVQEQGQLAPTFLATAARLDNSERPALATLDALSAAAALSLGPIWHGSSLSQLPAQGLINHFTLSPPGLAS